MLNAFCVAGVNQSNVWKRPVNLPGYFLSRNDVFQDETCVIKHYNLVRFRSKGQLNNTPQSEDFLVDWSYKLTIIDNLNENVRSTLFSSLNESEKIDEIEYGIYTYLMSNNRSLIMIKPDRITECPCFRDPYKGFKTRIKFMLNNIGYDISCTDLRWRAYMRNVENRAGSVNLLNNREVYFTIGLTRKPVQERLWSMVIGIHLLPGLGIDIDYNNL